jgi:mannose-1-phosphate guanylyltransferase
VPVGDRPLLVHIAERLARGGVGELVLNLHHRVEEFSSGISQLPLKVHVIHEQTIRGTAGGIAGARSLLEPGPALVVNGDILCDAPFAELLARVSDGLCMAVRPRPRGEGSVGVDRSGAIVRLRGQVFGDEQSGGDYVGAAALGARCLATLPAMGCLVGDWALPELARGGRIDTVACDGEWLDIGSLETYRDANWRWLERALDQNVPGTHGARSSFVGAGARVSPEVTLEGSLVGAGAEVKGHGAVARSVIWPGAVAHAPLEDAIVTTRGLIVR